MNIIDGFVSGPDGAKDKASGENHGPTSTLDGEEPTPMMLRSLLNEPAEAHHHETVELILNLGKTLGTVTWRDADGQEKTERLDSGDFCLIPAGVTHLTDGLRTRGTVSLLAGGAVLAEVAHLNLSGVFVTNLRQIALHDSMAGGLIAELTRVVARQPHVLLVNALGLALAFKLLHVILYREKQYVPAISMFSGSEQKRIMEHLAAHSAERVQVAALAHRLGFSRAHFTRRFRATFGMSPLQYALKMRVDRGIELLRSGEYRVAEAAYAVGFYDQSHFDRHCRKFYGTPPSSLHG
jgi:AraC-like DNA-binding protein